MFDVDWGLFCLGLLIGTVGATTALLAFAVVESVETGKDGKKMKDCFDKPIKVVTTRDIRPGDFIHDIADPASLLDIEKRKGRVTSIKIKSNRAILRLTGRRTPLEVPENTNAVITAAGRFGA